MNKLSVVIISFNASKTIKMVLQAALKVSTDVIVVDSYSEDDTKQICAQYPVKFVEQKWQGYGKQKNIGIALSQHNWILSIDSDEVISPALQIELQQLALNEKFVYALPFTNIYCGKEIRYGRWRNERHVRLFHKKEVCWNEDPVHEYLLYSEKESIHLKQAILHYSMFSKEEHLAKAKKYAKMGATKLKSKGKKAGLIKLYINPIFRFVKDYFFSLGFLDGKLGFQLAIIISKETYWKYKNLKDL